MTDSANFIEALGIRFTEVGKERILAEMDTGPQHTNGANVVHGGVYMAFADTLGARGTIMNLPDGTRVAGFKEIRYHTVAPRPMLPIQFMARFFPKARFILNTRSHAGTMQSGWWATMKPETVTRELRSAEALFDGIAAEYPDRSLRLHYDDYAGRPETLRPLYDFLGEPFDAARVAAVMGERLKHSGVKDSS